MKLADHLSCDRILSLRSRTKRGALRELVRAACRGSDELCLEPAFAAVWEREAVVSSWVDEGFAIPHARLPGRRGFVVAVGRSRRGIAFESADGRPVHLLVLILGGAEEPDEHLRLLAETARALRTPELRERVVAARTAAQARRLIVGAAASGRRGHRGPEVTRSLLAHARALARETSSKAILVDYDGLGSAEPLRGLRGGVEVILVTQGRLPVPDAVGARHRTILAPFSGLSRGSQRSLILLLALSQGLLRPEDRVINLYGLPGADTIDTLSVVEVGRELPAFTSSSSPHLFEDVEPQVLTRVIQLADDLATEGREGHPVGTAFLIGDYERVRALTSQLVINPFRGYGDEERNILDPSLEETVKEFANLDGAFVVRGDGVIVSAGTYLRPDRASPRLLSGLGTRHAAAAGITFQTGAVAVVLSQSTGRVSLFKGGVLVSELRKARS